MAVAGQGGVINGQKLGTWLAAQAGRIVGGLSIEHGGMEHDNVVSWRLIDHSRKAGAARSPQPPSEEAGRDIPF